MPTLHVRSVPDKLYVRLQNLARARQRSLSAQVIALLDSALEDETARARQVRTLARIRRRRFAPPPGAPDSVTLLREDRRR
jgi:plasmid stability protein